MPSYTAYRVSKPINIDGALAEPAWALAPKSESFVDMVTGEAAPYDTRVAILWDDERLYVGYWVEEPYPEAHLTHRDSLIFQEKDVELFIDGGDCYYEFEINALGTIYEVFFIWRDAYKRGGPFDIPEFDTFNALTFAGDYDRTPEHFWDGTHPRGVRWAFRNWDMPGLQSAVRIDGHLNDPDTVSRGWTVEISIPWASMKHLANGRSLPPKEGDVWRMFLGRFQKVLTPAGEVQKAWCLTPHGVFDTHMPEKFTPVTFSERAVEAL